MILCMICRLVCVTDSWAHMRMVHSILSLKLGVTLRVRSGRGEGLSLQRRTDERDGMSGVRNDDGSGAASAADERGRERYLRDGGEEPRPD